MNFDSEPSPFRAPHKYQKKTTLGGQAYMAGLYDMSVGKN